MENFTQDRTGHGTKEWAEINANIQQGCSNDCLYCYARANALRFGKIKNREEWREEKVDQNAVSKKWSKKNGVIMFPTTHDINMANYDSVTAFLWNVLKSGNQVLIVSKPRIECISLLCNDLKIYKDQILFRFTIGTINPEQSMFWEPGAPLPTERIAALEHARSGGYQTSVSMEPMLAGAATAIDTYQAVEPYVTETVWIGKMNRLRGRINPSPANLKAIEQIEHWQRDQQILTLVDVLKNEPKVRWKDSIKQVIAG